MASNRRSKNFEYDVCLSFAGEDRAYVTAVARALQHRGTRLFFADDNQVAMWGKDLYTYLDDVYTNLARYCVMFISKHYARKNWTDHERQSAQVRAFRESNAYVLPARFDDTRIPGLRGTVHYVDLRNMAPAEFAKLIWEKAGPYQRKFYMPPAPDRLFQALKAHTKKAAADVGRTAEAFVRDLSRMTEEERSVLTLAFVHGCAFHLIETRKQIHVPIATISRFANLPESKVDRILAGLAGMGVRAQIKRFSEDGSPALPHIYLTYRPRGYGGSAKHPMEVVHKMIGLAQQHYCECHHEQIVKIGDFGYLSSEVVADVHDCEADHRGAQDAAGKTQGVKRHRAKTAPARTGRKQLQGRKPPP